MRCQEGLWVGGSPHLTHCSPDYVVLRNTDGGSYNFMNCEGWWMIESDGLTDHGVTGKFLCH